MDGRRRQRSDYGNQVAAGTRSQNRKPPLGNWQRTVPSWEKKFCYVVGSIPWRKFLETKKFIHLYDNVLKWNDSAGEEAFHNAKNRFWAELNGLPCDISIPDPDIYIDKIDWNSKVDQELLRDLESESAVPDDQTKNEQVVILSEPLNANDLFSSYGWGDTEMDLKKTSNASKENKGDPWDPNLAQANGAVRTNGWGDADNSWYINETNGAVNDVIWEDDWNRCRGISPWENDNYQPNCLNYGNNYLNHRNQEINSWNMSRYRTRKNEQGSKTGDLLYELSLKDAGTRSRQWGR